MNVPTDPNPSPQTTDSDSWGIQFLSLPWWSLLICWGGLLMIFNAFRDLYVLFTRDPSLIGQDSLVESFLILGGLFSLLMGVVQWVCENQGIEIKPSSWSAFLMKTGGILLAIGFGFVILNIVIPTMHKAQRAQISRAQQKEQLNSPWKRHLFGDGKWSISVPTDWQEMPQAVPLAGSIMLAAPNQNYTLGAAAISNDDTSPVSLKELIEHRVRETHLSEMGQANIGEAYEYQMAGFPMQAISLTLRKNQETFFVDFFVHKSGSERLEIQLWRKTAGAPSQDEVLHRILQSVSAH